MAGVTRFGNAYTLFLNPRHCTIVSSSILRVNPQKNILRKFLYSVMQHNQCKNSFTCKTREISTSSFKAQENVFSTLEVQKLEDNWKKQFQDTQLFGEAIFVLGPMGAGKTTVIENEFRSHPIYSKYAYVDTDEIMGKIPYFSSDKVEEYYPIARGMAIRLTDWILEQRISFIAEGTCVKYLELVDYMQRLKSNGGYTIRVKRLPQVPLDIVLERAKHRINRKVPEHVVKDIYFGSAKGLDGMYEFNKTNGLFEDIDELNDNGVLEKPLDSNSIHFTQL